MSYYSCQDFPDVLRLETHVVDTRPDAVTLRHTSFYPGGGAQLADRGTLLWTGGEVAVTGFETLTPGRPRRMKQIGAIVRSASPGICPDVDPGGSGPRAKRGVHHRGSGARRAT
jgi:hypothetical protein